MSSNMDNFGSEAEKGVKSAEKLTKSIESVGSAISALDIGGLERLGETLAEICGQFETLNESLAVFTEKNEESGESSLSLTEQIGIVAASLGDIQKGFDAAAKYAGEANAKMFQSASAAAMFSNAALTAFGSLGTLVTGWQDMSSAEKFAAVMQSVAAGAVAVAGALALAKSAGGGPLGLIAAVAMIGGAIASFVTMTQQSSEAIKSYSSGGGFNTADLFYANENGAVELVASSNAGGGAVMNMEQLRSAVYDGVYAAIQAGGGRGEGTVVLDGVKVGKLVARGVYNEGSRVGYWR